MKTIKIITTSLILLLLLLNACQSENEKERQELIKDSQSRELDSTSIYSNRNFIIYTLDSCQYVVVGIGNSRWGSHKGDCTNPIHNQK